MARLRVGVAPHLRELAEGSGHTNAWRRTLEHLAARDDIRLVFDDKRRRLGRAPDVYLGDGHAGNGTRPHRSRWSLHEAGWLDPELGRAAYRSSPGHRRPHRGRAGAWPTASSRRRRRHAAR